jgi:hypothetical protein
MSGKVLVIGTAFLVTGAAWALMSFYQFVGGEQPLGLLDLLLAVIHVFAGLLLYRRVPYSVPLGLVVVLLGLAAAFLNAYLFLLVPDGLTGLLLLIAHREWSRRG